MTDAVSSGRHPQLSNGAGAPTARVPIDLPFTVLGGEVHNSSSSTVDSIARSFRRVRELGANTVLAPVAWDLMEPIEGSFDFTLVDAMLATARAEELRLIPLWFGSWKNAASSYAPPWVKRDADRFFRAETRAGRVEHVSPFSLEARQADALAFGALMAHIRDADAVGTVLMVQVENEVGLLGDSRDRSAAAESQWRSAIPESVIEAIAQNPSIPVHERWRASGRRTVGTWSEVLGETVDTDEAFMAWAYADFIEAVASAGAAQHALPMFVNAWLDTAETVEPSLVDSGPDLAVAGGNAPGDYPSGGPLSRVAPIWLSTAPTLALLAPDAYFGDFHSICADYRAASGQLFIPEMRRSPLGVAQMFVAVAEYGAVGVSPFGVDSVPVGGAEEAVLRDGYQLLRAIGSASRSRDPGASRGFLLDEQIPRVDIEVGAHIVSVTAADHPVSSGSTPGFGAVIEERPDTLLIAGRGFTASIARRDGAPAGILAATELDVDDEGAVHVTSRLNGDEGSGMQIRFPPLVPQPTLFPIPFRAHSSGIVRVELYTY